MRGNCYVTSEALYHLLGGKAAGWKAMRMKHEGDTHWFLINVHTGQIVDVTVSQFKEPPTVDEYFWAVGTGFLTKKPSKRARVLMEKLLWQKESL